jgi:repressor LexA
MKDIGKLLSTYRKKAGLTQPQLAEELRKNGIEIGFRSISTWEKNVCEPSVTVFLNICKILNIPDVMEAYFGENTSNPLNNLNEAGHKKVTEYVSLLEGFKDGAYLKDRSAIYECEEKDSTAIVDFYAISKFIRIYDTRVSAGTGNFLDGEGYDEVNRCEYNVPEGADFGVRISGDSMTPRYADGQVVWVHQQETLEEGQIGIFELNNECYCKMLGYDGQKPQLISLNNKKYGPKIVQESDSFRTFGRVLN